MASPPVVHSLHYECDIGPHVFPVRKYALVRSRLEAEGALDAPVLEPAPASRDDLLLVHTFAYLDDLEAERLTPRTAMSELPLTAEIVSAYVLAAGGTTLAAREAMRVGGAVHLGGGFHHASAERAEGFCYINDLAVAIRVLQRDGAVHRAAVVDLDVHQGNGTALVFAGNPSVFTLSIHQENNYPIPKPPSDLDVGLADRTDDRAYLEALDGALDAVWAFGPEIVLYQAGADPYREDQLGGLALTLDGLVERDRRVLEGCARRDIPAVVTLGGGYARRVEDTVEIHRNTCLVALRRLSTPRNRSMIRAYVVRQGQVTEAEPTEAVRLAATGDVNVWVDIECESQSVVTSLLAPLAIHPLVIEDMIMEVNRPKVDSYGDYLYLVVHSARWEDERPLLRELDIVIGRNWLITYHEASSRACEAATGVLPRRPELLVEGPSRLLHYVLDVMADQYLPITDHVTEAIDHLEERVFDDKLVPDHVQIMRLKRGLSALRRIIGPQRDTLLALTRDEFRPIPPDIRPYLRDVYDRLARVSDLFDSFRDEIATVLELNVTMASNRLNEVIKRLTVIATVGLPLTVVTSYYGMNFEFPEYRTRHPHIFVLALLLASAFGTLWFLRRKRWL